MTEFEHHYILKNICSTELFHIIRYLDKVRDRSKLYSPTVEKEIKYAQGELEKLMAEVNQRGFELQERWEKAKKLEQRSILSRVNRLWKKWRAKQWQPQQHQISPKL